MATEARPRQRGSVRFDAYFKVQFWHEATMAWKDIQHAYPTVAEAEEAAPDVIDRDALRWRLMEVTPRGRSPLAEHRIHSSIFTEDCEHCGAALRWEGHDLADRRGNRKCGASPIGEHEA